MSAFSTSLGRVLLILLSISSFSACQRASYSFQPVGVAAVPLVAPEILVSVSEAKHKVPSLAPLSPPASHTSQLRLPGRRHRSLAVPLLHWQPVATKRAAPVAAKRVGQEIAGATAATDDAPPKQRSRAVAILLAALAITYLPLSLHNFYLGYYGRGAAAIGLLLVGTYLLLLGTVGFLTASSSLTVVGYIGLGLLAGWFLWQVTDLVRIITGDLKPKNGEYKPKKVRP